MPCHNLECVEVCCVSIWEAICVADRPPVPIVPAKGEIRKRQSQEMGAVFHKITNSR